MVRIILPSPATSVSCERLLNVGCNICHYRHGHLKPELIRKLVMMRHFDAKELAAEDLGSEEEVSTTPDSAPTRQDLDWAWHYINNRMIAVPTTVQGSQGKGARKSTLQDLDARDSIKLRLLWMSL